MFLYGLPVFLFLQLIDRIENWDTCIKSGFLTTTEKWRHRRKEEENGRGGLEGREKDRGQRNRDEKKEGEMRGPLGRQPWRNTPPLLQPLGKLSLLLVAGVLLKGLSLLLI